MTEKLLSYALKQIIMLVLSLETGLCPLNCSTSAVEKIIKSKLNDLIISLLDASIL